MASLKDLKNKGLKAWKKVIILPYFLLGTVVGIVVCIVTEHTKK